MGPRYRSRNFSGANSISLGNNKDLCRTRVYSKGNHGSLQIPSLTQMNVTCLHGVRTETVVTGSTDSEPSSAWGQLPPPPPTLSQASARLFSNHKALLGGWDLLCMTSLSSFSTLIYFSNWLTYLRYSSDNVGSQAVEIVFSEDREPQISPECRGVEREAWDGQPGVRWRQRWTREAPTFQTPNAKMPIKETPLHKRFCTKWRRDILTTQTLLRSGGRGNQKGAVHRKTATGAVTVL